MKILHINDKLNISGGVEVYIDEINQALNNLSIESKWISIKKNNKQIIINSTDKNLSWSGFLKNFDESSIAKWINHETIIHVHSLSEPEIINKLFSIGTVIRHMHEPRMICPGQGKFLAKTESICNKPFRNDCIIDAYTKKCCNRNPKLLLKQFSNTKFEINIASRKYSKIIANSRYLYNEALKAGYQHKNITVLPYFTPVIPIHKENLKNKKNNILYVGRLSRSKGIHYLIQAMIQITNANPKAMLDILGSGHDESFLRDLVNKLNLNKNIKFHGWCDRLTISSFMSKTSVLAFPSIYPESFGISGIEAMMHGKPIVGFNVGGVSDWLKDNKNGYLIDVKNTNELSDKILYLLNNKLKQVEMGRIGRTMAIEYFSPQVHLEKLLTIYRTSLK